MAIKSGGISRDGKRVMTVEEFKKWLLSRFDANGDGRISLEELQSLMRFTGKHFVAWKSRRVIRSLDSDNNGFIDQSEITGLIDLAAKHLDLKIVQF